MRCHLPTLSLRVNACQAREGEKGGRGSRVCLGQKYMGVACLLGGGRVEIVKDYNNIYWCCETIIFIFRQFCCWFGFGISFTKHSFSPVLTMKSAIWLFLNISNKISDPGALQVIFWLWGGEGVLVLGYIFTGDTPSLLWQASAVKLFFKHDWFGRSAFEMILKSQSFRFLKVSESDAS